MKIAIGSDHRGYRTKTELVCLLENLGHDVVDFGCYGVQSVDYPDIARPLAEAVGSRRLELGILVGGNGMGMCIVANKVHGVRAAVADDEFSAQCIREQYHCNVLCLGDETDAGRHFEHIVNEYLRATTADGRHARRVKKIIQMEQAMELFPDGVGSEPVDPSLADNASKEGHGLTS